MMTTAYRQAIAAAGAAEIRFIGLVDDAGVELAGDRYARQAVSWDRPVDGTIQPRADLVFQIPAATIVSGWRGYAESFAGVNFGGSDLTPEAYANAGEYRLMAEFTGIVHQAL